MRKVLTALKKHSRSLTVRIIVIMILLVIPLNIWGIVTASEMRKYIYADNRNNLYSIGQLTMKDIDSRMRSVDFYLFDTLPENSVYFSVVRKQAGDERFYHMAYNLHRDLYNRASTNNDADVYFYYSTDADYCDIAANSEILSSQKLEKESIVELLNADDDIVRRQWQMITMGESRWLFRCVRQKTFYYGAMISVDEIFETVKGSLNYKTLGVNMVDNEAIEKDVQAENNSLEISDRTYGLLNDSGHVSVLCDSQKADVSIHIYVDEAEVERGLSLFQRLGVGISLIFLCVFPLIILFLNRFLLRPIKHMVKAMNTVKEGEWTYQIEEKANSEEFKELYDNFNRMVKTQVETNHELIEKETWGKKMELQTLQLQIRPHFLLNSFNLLYGLVTMKKIESAQKMIIYLSDYFRYIFRSGKDMEVYSKELALIINYIDVARLRYPFIAFDESHDEDVLFVDVPPLLIHNFVENVFKHGLKPKGLTHIRLSAQYIENEAVFVIEDDGRGIEPEIVDRINSATFLEKDERVHVGLKNALQRIRYFYGEEGHMHVASVPGQGTRIAIRVRCGLHPVGKTDDEGVLDK